MLQLVYFWTKRSDHSSDEAHEEMVGSMKDLAVINPGFIEWRECSDDLTYWGVIVFADAEAALAWKEDPRHKALHQQGEERVYSAFGTQVFQLVREAHWSRSENSD